MTPAPRAPRSELTGPTLLLSERAEPGVDVVLVDLDDLEVDGIEPAVAAARTGSTRAVGTVGGSPGAVHAALRAGVDLVVLDLADASEPEVRAVVESGAVVVLHHAVPTVASAAVDRLAAGGVDTGRVVVEVGPGADQLDRVAALERTAVGHRVGVQLAPGTTDVDPDEAADGREIAVLTELLTRGVATVRGAGARRFTRVRAVLDAIDAAVEAPPVGAGGAREVAAP